MRIVITKTKNWVLRSFHLAFSQNSNHRTAQVLKPAGTGRCVTVTCKFDPTIKSTLWLTAHYVLYDLGCFLYITDFESIGYR